jgi:hypothetical protein
MAHLSLDGKVAAVIFVPFCDGFAVDGPAVLSLLRAKLLETDPRCLIAAS